MAGINHVAVKSSHDTGLASEWNDDHEQKGNHDCAKFQHLNHVIENRTTMPAGPVEGQVIYRSDQHSFYVWNGTIWVSMTGPATVVVAIDGSGDTTDIQEGIDQLPGTGGVVYIKEGTYTLTARIEIASNNVSLMGAGYSTIITTLGNFELILVGASNNVVLADLSFIGSGVANPQNTGIEFNGCDDCRIFRCWVSNCGATGIEVNDSPNIIISLCNVTTSTLQGIYVFSNSPKCVIQGNTLHTNTQHGIQIRGSDSLVSGNLIYDNVREGIRVFGADNCVIDGNVIYGNDSGLTALYNGIKITNNADQNIISNNNCHDNDGNEIRINDNTCDKNIIMGNICLGVHANAIVDLGTNTHPNGASGTNNLQLDDLNIIA